MKNVIKKKKSSVYDSDTESSRMRKLNNNRSSPFRQTSSRPKQHNMSNLSNLSNSGKKTPRNNKNLI